MNQGMKVVRWIVVLLVVVFSLVGCGGGATAPMVPYRNALVYPATAATIDSAIPMTYTFQVLHEEHRPSLMIHVRTNGIVTTTMPLSITVGPLERGRDYSLPLTFTLTAKGEGTLLVFYAPEPGIVLHEEVFVLATDEGVFLNSLSRFGVYTFYLNELGSRANLDEAITSQRRQQLIEERGLTVPINGTPTIVNYGLPDLFIRP